ncbi:hypothetical protein CVT26_001107 [Gymnopilus dilepis]|uniref:Uncharacterized protein n=1 Tax=Gymnopilus dilepis TaxID=231916 RepID=A0A409W7E5_9AGAR|nr:hypothetical protein CVT26_001107 [Gymnopilus dilepis]
MSKLQGIYNQLPLIFEASRQFKDNLASTGHTVGSLLAELQDLFDDPRYKGKYGVWLLHRHFELNTGERMVKRDEHIDDGKSPKNYRTVTEPTADQASNIVAERWSPFGDELEHAYTAEGSNLTPAPDAYFFQEFHRIMVVNNIVGQDNVPRLGICLYPSPEVLEIVDSGYFIVERTNPKDPRRLHVVTAVAKNDSTMTDPDSFVESEWTMSEDWGYRCHHVCQGPTCAKSPPAANVVKKSA